MKTTDTHDRLVYIDVLKSIACLCVMVGHVINGLIRDGLAVSDLLRMINSYVYLFHVPCFFFASGYLYANKRLETRDDYFHFIFKKLVVLGLPYVVCSIAYILFSSVLSADMHTAYSFQAILSLGVSPVAQYWYLYALFEMFLIVPVVEFLLRRVDQRWILLGFILCAFIPQADIACIKYATAYTCFFYMGACFNYKGVAQKACILQRSAGSLFLLSFSASLGVYFVYYFVDGADLPVSEINYVIKGIVKLLLVISMVGISFAIAEMEGVVRKFLLWLSQYSLYIFLFHTWFTGTLRVVLRRMGITDCWVQTIGGILIGLVGSLIAAAVIKRVMIFRFWFEPFQVADACKRRRQG